jgi:penicillin amidase
MKRMLALAGVVLVAAGGGCLRMAVVKDRYEKAPALPQVEGTLSVAGLEGPVDVYRDDYGVPHLFTENEHDLFFAIGYVQAQDRLWSMVLMRAISEGRLAELFGDLGVPGGMELQGFVLSTTGMDRRQRVMGMKWLGEVGEALLREADPQVHCQLQAYCDGINAFLDTHREWEQLPIEFQVLNVKPEPFHIADLMSLNLFLGQMLAGNMDAELLRYGLFRKYGEDLGRELAPLHYAPGPTIVPADILPNRLGQARSLPPGGRPSTQELGYSLHDLDPQLTADSALDLLLAETAIKSVLYIEYPFASNNWIIGPKLTATGTAMLANDPHLTHIQPSLVYLMHIKGAGYDCYGATFPGNPYLVLGHTRKLAWGETTTAADVQDLFVETTDRGHPDMYKYKGEWRPFTVREEVIRIKVPGGFLARKIRIRQTIHGPVMNDVLPGLPRDTPPLALRWVAWDFNRDVKQFEKLVTSASLEEFLSKLTPEEIRAAGRMNSGI